MPFRRMHGQAATATIESKTTEPCQIEQSVIQSFSKEKVANHCQYLSYLMFVW